MLRKAGQDRFLVPRNGILYYWRRVPKTLVDVDSRAPFVRHSLKTDDLAKARSQRDILEKADNELWAAMLLDGAESIGALETYKAAKLLSEALGFSYRPAGELARQPVEDIVQRVTAIMDTRTPIVVEARHSRSIATRLSQTRSPARARRSASSGKRSNVGPSIRSSR